MTAKKEELYNRLIVLAHRAWNFQIATPYDHARLGSDVPRYKRDYGHVTEVPDSVDEIYNQIKNSLPDDYLWEFKTCYWTFKFLFGE